MLKLIMKTEGDRERVFAMASEQMTIGRGRSCDLRIPLPQVSTTHCRISAEQIDGGPRQVLESLDDDVGTHLNGVRVRKAVLADEDVVQIGPVVFHVAIAKGPDGQTFEIHRHDAPGDMPGTP
ncbi:MAG: FHA domain-containing protein [Phycisphaerales bacterium]|nr:FHA domain-containing protein [Phycisphaerales bacterium]